MLFYIGLKNSVIVLFLNNDGWTFGRTPHCDPGMKRGMSTCAPSDCNCSSSGGERKRRRRRRRRSTIRG